MGSHMAELRPEARIHGVEVSPELYDKALSRQPDQVTLELGDARKALRATHQRYDLILDDCFELIEGEASRPPELRRHAALARSRLAEHGFYVRNHLPDENHRFVREEIVDIDESFEWVAFRRFREWDNVLIVASRQPIERRAMRRL